MIKGRKLQSNFFYLQKRLAILGIIKTQRINLTSVFDDMHFSTRYNVHKSAIRYMAMLCKWLYSFPGIYILYNIKIKDSCLKKNVRIGG